MHTDATLAILDEETTALGAGLREFQSTTCVTYPTRELKREMEARKRHQIKKAQAGTPSPPLRGGKQVQDRQSKSFNLQRYKVHALGDYVSTIKRYGTTDSYTTAIVSLTVDYGCGS